MLSLWIVSFLLLLSVALLSVSIYFNIKHGKYIINITESLEESLDTLDARYENISKILEIPLFYDSPQIRQVQSDIAECRDSILYVANIIAESGNRQEEIEN